MFSPKLPERENRLISSSSNDAIKNQMTSPLIGLMIDGSRCEATRSGSRYVSSRNHGSGSTRQPVESGPIFPTLPPVSEKAAATTTARPTSLIVSYLKQKQGLDEPLTSSDFLHPALLLSPSSSCHVSKSSLSSVFSLLLQEVDANIPSFAPAANAVGDDEVMSENTTAVVAYQECFLARMAECAPPPPNTDCFSTQSPTIATKTATKVMSISEKTVDVEVPLSNISSPSPVLSQSPDVMPMMCQSNKKNDKYDNDSQNSHPDNAHGESWKPLLLGQPKLSAQLEEPCGQDQKETMQDYYPQKRQKVSHDDEFSMVGKQHDTKERKRYKVDAQLQEQQQPDQSKNQSTEENIIQYTKDDGQQISVGNESNVTKVDSSSALNPANSSAPSSPSNHRFRPCHADMWLEHFQDLIAYKEEHGHCQVPLTYSSDPSLSHWVKRQRYQYKLLQNGKPSTMTQERVQALQDIGFVWDSQNTAWAERFAELVEYQREHQHCNVPSQYPPNSALAIWVKSQRRQYKLFQQGKPSNLTPQRIRDLESIGFQWLLRSYHCNKNSVMMGKRKPSSSSEKTIDF